MTQPQLTIADDFPAVDYDTWRASVEADLKGVPFERKLVSHTYEGIDIQPVYTLRDQLPGEDPTGFPGAEPFIRGSAPLGHVLSGVDLRQEHAHPDLTHSNRAILADLEGGVTSVVLKFDRATRRGIAIDDPVAASMVGDDGMMITGVDDLDAVLKGVHLDLVDIALHAGAGVLPAATALAALWKRREIAHEHARGAFNGDPLATLAREGQLPITPESAIEQLGKLATWTAANYPRVTAVAVDTSVYHNSGATAAQDIALGMATAVEYLRAMTAAGLSIDDAAAQIVFRVSLGTHHFLALAKLRAARQLWARVLQASGARPAGMKLNTRTSDRVMTQRDPYVNLLRNSVAVFSGLLGGADSITSLPFDHMAELPTDFSRRIARNTLLILQEESHLHRVIDPAGGSWFLENLTKDLAVESWEIFQTLEAKGGLLAALRAGFVAEQIDAAYAPRLKDIAKRKEGITGVSEFPNLAEERLKSPPPDVSKLHAAAVDRVPAANLPSLDLDGDLMTSVYAAASSGASISQICKSLGFQAGSNEVEKIRPHVFAEPFERLRDASDDWVESQGERPKIFSANLGPVAHFTARATYAKNFFEAGGFEMVGDQGYVDPQSVADAFAKSGTKLAVICSSDKIYADLAVPVAAALKANGATTVILAGHPGEHEDAYRASGIDRFIYIKCDVLGTLRELLIQEGVLTS